MCLFMVALNINSLLANILVNILIKVILGDKSYFNPNFDIRDNFGLVNYFDINLGNYRWEDFDFLFIMVNQRY